MKAVIQRVTKASVTVDGQTVSSIGQGLCVLIGIHRDDTRKDMEYIVRKILNYRLFDNADGKRWNKSVKDLNHEVLCVSQFTLYHLMKGNKPDFHLSMSGDASKEFYLDFLSELRKNYCEDKIKDGQFGAMMQVVIQNDGPVTVEIESPNSNSKKE